MSFDVVILGAGTAGCTTACVASKKGLKVALVDRKPREQVGRKTCGDAIMEAPILRVDEEVGFPIPTGEELRSIVKGIDVYSPNFQHKLRLDDPGGSRGFIIDRLLFGQRFLDRAEELGAKIFTESRFKEVLFEDGHIAGILARSADRSLNELRAPLVVDASGTSALIRKALPDNLMGKIERTIHPLDNAIAYRHVLEFEPEFEDPEYIRIYFSQEMTSGGYAWIFPREDGANIGVGGVEIAMNILDVKAALERFLKAFPQYFSNAKPTHTGGGIVPVRRPNNSLVADNFVLVGDSGFQVNPLHGGGMDANLDAGIMLGNTLASAVEENDYSEAKLWEYATEYNRSTGVLHSGLDIFRLIAMDLTDHELDIVLGKEIIAQREIEWTIREGSLNLSWKQKLVKLWRGRRALGAIRKLLLLSNRMPAVKNMYENYPDKPELLQEWLEELEEIYVDIRKPFLKKYL